jgi:SAM-dependent methyltransferase
LYNTTAFLYDQTAAFEQPAQTAQQILDRFKAQGVEAPGLLGDLGAGTGVMAIQLAQAGWRLYGIEQSTAMIEISQQKTARLPKAVQDRLLWTQGDITDFTLPAAVRWDGAVCLCNTINHLGTLEAVDRFTNASWNALKSGGVLILDSDTLQTFQQFFDHPDTMVWENLQNGVPTRLLRRCSFNEQTGRANHLATLLRQPDPDGAWETVSEESMPLQYHAEPQLLEIFQKAGFTVINAELFNPNPILYAGMMPKVLWTLKKPA